MDSSYSVEERKRRIDKVIVEVSFVYITGELIQTNSSISI